MSVQNLITDHIETWTTAQVQKKSGGRGRSKKSNGQSQYGIKKLRELILDLAVRGKLVPQDLNDEPASVLLDKITVEKARLIKDGKIKKHKPVPKIDGNEAPYELPNCWKWVRVGDIGYGLGQKTPTSNFTYIDVSSINNTIGRVESPGMLTASEAPSRARKIVKVGTVIYSTVRPYLQNICVIDERYNPEPIASTAFAILHPFQQMPGKFLSLYLRSPVFVKYVESVQTGIAYPAINDKQFTGGLFPLPPLAEQHRIVTKVDELMTLCDQLEEEQTDKSETHQLLVKTLLDTLTNATDHADFIESWQRIEANFDILFTTEASIDELKKTILQLAVMGKLVPQDPNDEQAGIHFSKPLMLPAGYKRLKKQAVKDNHIGSANDLPPLPNTWVYKSVDDLYALNHILDYADGNHGSLYPRKNDFEEEGVIFLTAAQISNSGTIDWGNCPRLKNQKANKLTKGWSKPGDVFFTHNATVGRTAIAVDCPEIDFLLGTSVTFYRLNEGSILQRYLYWYFSSRSWYDQAASIMQQTTRNQVSITKQALFFIALPPIKEQFRIIEVIDKLLPLCDSIKERLNNAQTTQVKLADAIVGQAI